MKLSQNWWLEGEDLRAMPAPTEVVLLWRDTGPGGVRFPLGLLNGNVPFQLSFTDLPASYLPIANAYRFCSN
jgi:hypothetical protein